MLTIVMLAVFIIISIIMFLVLSAFSPARGDAALRLKALDAMTSGQSIPDTELAKPFAQRILSPLTGSLSDRLVQLAPTVFRRTIEKKLFSAGGFSGLTTNTFLLLCGFLAVILSLFIVVIAALKGVPTFKVVGLAVIGFAFGLLLPLCLLNLKIAKRKKSIQRDLPDVLDLITVSVEAGLAFDGALTKLTEKMDGPLVDEFGRLLQEMRIGVPRRSALHSMARRCEVHDLSLFTTALIQADQLGVSIGNVLRVQSTAMREKRRQRAKEKAQMAPVKMLLPLVGLIFPAVFVVLAGPALISISAALANR